MCSFLAKLPDLDPLNLNDCPEADHSVQGEVVQSSRETQTEDCPAYNGGRCYHSQMSNGFSDKGKRSHRAIGHLSSPVFGQHAIIVDDMIDTGHTIGFCLDVSHDECKALNTCLKKSFNSWINVWVVSVHSLY